MQKFIGSFLIGLSFIVLSGVFFAAPIYAAPDLDMSTPAIAAIKKNMQSRHGELAQHFMSGAVGLTQDGLIALRDATAVPLKDRQGINALLAAENADRNALYKEIAASNGHPEWRGDIQSTFAMRWIDKAQVGWYYQKDSGWIKK